MPSPIPFPAHQPCKLPPSSCASHKRMPSPKWRTHLCLLSGPTILLSLWSASIIRGAAATFSQDPDDQIQIPLFADDPAMHPWKIASSILGGTALANASASVFDYVNPLIGTTGADPAEYGGMIPSTAPPFGMTRWSPMTRENWVSRLPYHWNDTSIAGFIGTHQPAIWMVSSPPFFSCCAYLLHDDAPGRLWLRGSMSWNWDSQNSIHRQRHGILAL